MHFRFSSEWSSDVSEVQVSAVLSDGHLMRPSSPKLYADNFCILRFDELNADIAVHKCFILIMFQPTVSLQPLWKEFPFFFSLSLLEVEALPTTLSLSGTLVGSSSFV